MWISKHYFMQSVQTSDPQTLSLIVPFNRINIIIYNRMGMHVEVGKLSSIHTFHTRRSSYVSQVFIYYGNVIHVGTSHTTIYVEQKNISHVFYSIQAAVCTNPNDFVLINNHNLWNSIYIDTHCFCIWVY